MVRKIFFYLTLTLLLILGTLWAALHSQVFWRWAGQRLIMAANEQLQGELTVQKISGTPFAGYTWEGLKLTSPAGEVFRARGFMLRLSLWSLVRLAPVVDKLALYEPVLNLVQDGEGRWNLTQLLPPREGPPARAPIPLHSLTFSQIIIANGAVGLETPGARHRFEAIDLDLKLRLLEPLSDQPRLDVEDAQVAGATPWGRFTANTRFTAGAGGLDLAALTLSSEARQLLTASGRLCLDRQGPSDLAGVIGPLPPAFLARFYPDWPCDWQAGGAFQVRGGPDELSFSLEGNLHQAALNLEGRVHLAAAPEKYDLRVHLTKVTPAMLAALELPGQEVYTKMSPLGARLHLQGAGLSWPPPEFSWRLAAEPFSYQAARLEKLEVSFAGTAGAQELKAEVAGNLGSLSLTSRGSFFTTPQGSITLRVADFQPARLGFPQVGDTSLTAGFDGQFRLADPGRPDSLTINGAVNASGRVLGHPLHVLQARFGWQQPRLTLPEVRVHLGNLMVQASGVMDGQRLDFQHRGETRPGGAWPVPSALKGALAWTGAVQGTVVAPEYFLEAQGKKLAVAEVGLKAFSFRLQGLGLPPRTAVMELSAGDVKTPAGTFAELRFRANVQEQRWCYRLWASSPAPGPLAELFGSLDLGSRPVSLFVSHLRLHLWNLKIRNTTDIQARFLPGLDLPTAAFDLNGGQVQVAARLQGQDLAARLEVRQVPLSLAGLKGLQGHLQSVLSLSGTLQRPELEGSFNLTPLRYDTYAVQAIDTKISYRDGLFTLTGQALEKPGGVRLVWDGELPWQISLLPFRAPLPEEGLDFTLRSEGANLRFLETVTPEISRADVPLDLNLRVRGGWRRPDVEAHVRWQQGFVLLRQAGLKYLVAPGVLTWQGDRLSLPQLTLESRGTIKVTGDVDFSGYQPRQVKAQVQIDNFKVLDRLASEAFLDGQMALSGPLNALVLRGQLSIPRAALNPALIRPATRSHPDIIRVQGKKLPEASKTPPDPGPEVYRNMKIDLAVEAPGNVWIRQKTPQVGAQVELSLDIRARKEPGQELALGGMVRSLEGNLTVFNKDFTVDKAWVTLSGKPGQEPFVEARLSHAMTDTTLIVDVFGPANKPQIELSSSPPLPPNDLMSYLLFDRPAGALSQSEFNAGQQAAGVLGGITASKIQEILGDDFPILGDVSVKSTAGSIGLARTLAKGVTISVERRTSPTSREDPTTVRLEYRLNRRLRLQAEQGQRNTGADILFKYDF